MITLKQAVAAFVAAGVPTRAVKFREKDPPLPRCTYRLVRTENQPGDDTVIAVVATYDFELACRDREIDLEHDVESRLACHWQKEGDEDPAEDIVLTTYTISLREE